MSCLHESHHLRQYRNRTFDISKIFNLTRFDGIVAENPPVTPSGMIIPLF